jgi:hypothetical protein
VTSVFVGLVALLVDASGVLLMPRCSSVLTGHRGHGDGSSAGACERAQLAGCDRRLARGPPFCRLSVTFARPTYYRPGPVYEATVDSLTSLRPLHVSWVVVVDDGDALSVRSAVPVGISTRYGIDR